MVVDWLFVVQGYEYISIEDICCVVGVMWFVVYDYYSFKEGFYFVCVCCICVGYECDFMLVFVDVESLCEQFECVVGVYFGMVEIDLQCWLLFYGGVVVFLIGELGQQLLELWL